MQDRFKFRTWNSDLKCFTYWGWVEDGEYKNLCSCRDIPKDELLEKYTQQCTGLKDKNGKLIYEGDIVKLTGDGVDNIHIVKFGDFAIYDFDFQKDYEKGSTAVYGWYLGGQKYPIPLSISLETSGLEIEVIGNIYENPEL